MRIQTKVSPQTLTLMCVRREFTLLWTGPLWSSQALEEDEALITTEPITHCCLNWIANCPQLTLRWEVTAVVSIACPSLVRWTSCNVESINELRPWLFWMREFSIKWDVSVCKLAEKRRGLCYHCDINQSFRSDFACDVQEEKGRQQVNTELLEPVRWMIRNVSSDCVAAPNQPIRKAKTKRAVWPWGSESGLRTSTPHTKTTG